MKSEKRRDPLDWTFLVVDNDAQVRQVLQEYLQLLGYRHVLTAKNGREALQIIQNPLQRLDVVLSDWEMPQMNGIELLRTLKKMRNRAHVSFVMVTSESSLERMKVSKSLSLRVDHYILKPFRKSVLKQKIDEIINGLDVIESAVSADSHPKTKVKVIAGSNLQAGSIKIHDDLDSSAIFGKFISKLTEQGGLGKVLIEQAGNKVADGTVTEQVNIKAMLKLAKIYKPVEWFDRPIKIFTEATTLLPDFAEVWFYLGLSHYYRGNLPEALISFQRTTELDSKHKDAIELIEELNKFRKVS
jgi:two-component system, chemotaxis family, chemotaxis protein CheY